MNRKEELDANKNKKHYSSLSSRETNPTKPSTSTTTSTIQQGGGVRYKVGRRHRVIQETYEEEELNIEASISRIDKIHIQHDHLPPVIGGDLGDKPDPNSGGSRSRKEYTAAHQRHQRRGQRSPSSAEVSDDDESDSHVQRFPDRSRESFVPHGANRRQRIVKDDDIDSDEDSELDLSPRPKRGQQDDAYLRRGQSRNIPATRGNRGRGAQPAKGIKHFTHRHPLKHVKIRSKDDIYCKFCDFQISGAAFQCASREECHFFIHQACFQIPKYIKGHFYQPEHTIILRSTENAGQDLSCKACLEDIDIQFSYYYSCTSCDEYQIHVDCGSMPINLDPNNIVEYPLTLFFSPLLGNDRRGNNKCVVCKQKIIQGSWIYYNKKHDCITHLICPMSKQEDDEFLFGVMTRLVPKASHNEHEDNQYSEHQLRKEQNDEEDEKGVYRFGHPHPIKEFTAEELENHEKEIDINCWVCGPGKADKYHGCLICGFFVCKTCFRLPEKVQFSSHCDQAFINLNEFDNNGNRRNQQGYCFLCGYSYDLAFYGCDVCHYSIHATCLGNSSGIAVNNNGQRFRLVPGNEAAKSGGGNCSACRRFVAKAGSYVYKGERVDTMYCMWCALDSFNSLMSIDEDAFVNRVQSYRAG